MEQSPNLSALLPLIALLPFLASAANYSSIFTQGSSLSPPDDFIVSPSRTFTAGFYPAGENAFIFAIWFTEPVVDGNFTVVWMANRDQPVNGRKTNFFLSGTGNLVLMDAGQIVIWTSGTSSQSALRLELLDNGNLALNGDAGDTIWQSFDSPTNTLLPLQPLTRNSPLISSRSLTNHSPGFYKLFFDNDNVLSLLYDGIDITSVFWPSPWLSSWQAGRSTYNDSKTAVLDVMGTFSSSDGFSFRTADVGFGPQRRMTLDPDGNLRVYSFDRGEKIWEVTWQLTIEPCMTHGICGVNSLCSYTPESGPSCSCLPGYKMQDTSDWMEGCVPDFEMPCDDNDSTYFQKFNHAEFYGYDTGYFQNKTLEECENMCLSYCSCKGFQYKFEEANGFYSCFPKTTLFNGYQSTGFEYWMYIRLPKNRLFTDEKTSQQSQFSCEGQVIELDRLYSKRHQRTWIKPLFWSTGVLGTIEIICLLIFLYKTRKLPGAGSQGYLQAATGFKRFTYRELKKASRGFSEEIGRGGGGIVYKGRLPDNQIAAIKRLKMNDLNQGEAEFLAEVSLIGRLNHANLIESWGYCAEGRHRLLVYEYVENGSLAANLNSGKLDWEQRFNIALGTAKGLAYLHEECLEWVLHCDVKPQNILLDSDFQPKVADFGLSKLLNRGSNSMEQSKVSRIRGTRGYMAPEWVFNLPITSKVDVYSYGIVVLEMLTGRSPKGQNANGDHSDIEEHCTLESWVRERMKAVDEEAFSWVHDIADPNMGGDYEVERFKNLVQVALLCADENSDARPTMRQVVDMLLYQDD